MVLPRKPRIQKKVLRAMMEGLDKEGVVHNQLVPADFGRNFRNSKLPAWEQRLPRMSVFRTPIMDLSVAISRCFVTTARISKFLWRMGSPVVTKRNGLHSDIRITKINKPALDKIAQATERLESDTKRIQKVMITMSDTVATRAALIALRGMFGKTSTSTEAPILTLLLDRPRASAARNLRSKRKNNKWTSEILSTTELYSAVLRIRSLYYNDRLLPPTKFTLLPERDVKHHVWKAYNKALIVLLSRFDLQLWSIGRTVDPIIRNINGLIAWAERNGGFNSRRKPETPVYKMTESTNEPTDED
ncbi:hypothetical protein F5B20DRAFT_560992 [Whalleya microplaca]|nr:hypothetical protein F5B20DRAFT_560992 [Whalleya microplaca]